MTAGNIQNSKRISLYGSKQTHGIDWQNHFFPFLSFETIQKQHKSHPESLHTTNEKGPKHVTFSPHLPESRWHPLHFLKSLCTYKRKKENTETTVSVSFSRLWGGGEHFGQRTDEVVHFRKLEKQQKQNQKKLDASALAQKQPHRKLGGGWWVLVRR